MERPRDFYYFCLTHLALVSFVAWWLIRSPWGRAFVAVRENPVRALSLGVDTRRYTLMAFAIGAALGGISGALYAPLVQFLDPTPFSLGLSLNLLLMVVVGGSGFSSAPSSAPSWPCSCRSGCASPRATTSWAMRSWWWC